MKKEDITKMLFEREYEKLSTSHFSGLSKFELYKLMNTRIYVALFELENYGLELCVFKSYSHCENGLIDDMYRYGLSFFPKNIEQARVLI